ncbi:MAG TPA: sodium:solute symporter family protein [Prolixibacteraceae bacterium]
MIIYLSITVYIVSMILIGIVSSRKIRSEGDYYVAGKRGNLWQITGSLLATILGSSAILGTADLALTQGWAASWLLFSASAGLFLLVPFSMVVRRQGKYTLPQMIGDFYGIEAKMISSFIISFAWIGIIAAQIIGAAKIMTGFTGLDYSIGVWGAGAVFIFYTVIGGQISVLKTDLYQTAIILAGILITALYILFSEPVSPMAMTALNFPFNEGFRAFDLIVLLLTYSTTYVVGPDIYSRIFCAENEHIARKSVLISAIVLIPFSLCITYLGVFAAFKFPTLHLQKGSALIPVMVSTLPEWGVGLLIAALLSAVMSSASTALLTSATIISDPVSKGLDQKKSLRNTKAIMLIIGTLSIILSLHVQSIIQSLLIALTIFSGAFIIPTAAGLLGFRTSKTRSGIAMITGGGIALTGKILALNGENIAGNLLIITGFALNALILFSGYFPNLLTLRRKINLTSK